MDDKPALIVNADDFGLSAGVNRGIAEAHERGIVTSASLMVRWPDARAAADYVSEHPELSLGLHLDMGEWFFRDGEWVTLYEVVPLDDEAALRHEVGVQLERFRQLTGREPTHLDSHQHVHRREPLCSMVVELGSALAIPVRHRSAQVRYCGDFYGQTSEGRSLPDMISADRLLQIIARLQPGVTELACHPGYGDGLLTMYRDERAREVEALCDPRVVDRVRRAVAILSFSDVLVERRD